MKVKPRSGYAQRIDGEWFHLARRGHLIACCDCGLVHMVVPRIRAGKIEIKVRRMPRLTAARRLSRKITVKHT